MSDAAKTAACLLISDAPKGVQALFQLANTARLNAYSPYSRVKVGAAVQAASGKLYGGCNVENSSYGGSNCAERVAIQKAVSEGEHQIQAVMVVTEASPAWPPCGFCRQVMNEFVVSDQPLLVYICNTQGKYQTTTLEALLPNSFSKDQLLKN